MDWKIVLAIIVVVVLMVYLITALIAPEKFS